MQNCLAICSDSRLSPLLLPPPRSPFSCNKLPPPPPTPTPTLPTSPGGWRTPFECWWWTGGWKWRAGGGGGGALRAFFPGASVWDQHHHYVIWMGSCAKAEEEDVFWVRNHPLLLCQAVLRHLSSDARKKKSLATKVCCTSFSFESPQRMLDYSIR